MSGIPQNQQALLWQRAAAAAIYDADYQRLLTLATAVFGACNTCTSSVELIATIQGALHELVRHEHNASDRHIAMAGRNAARNATLAARDAVLRALAASVRDLQTAHAAQAETIKALQLRIKQLGGDDVA